MADIGRCLLMPAVFVLIAAPYIIFLHSETGQWQLEGKSPLNFKRLSACCSPTKISGKCTMRSTAT